MKTLKEIIKENELQIAYNILNSEYYIVDHIEKKFYRTSVYNKILEHPYFEFCKDKDRIERILTDLTTLEIFLMVIDGDSYTVELGCCIDTNIIVSISSQKMGKTTDFYFGMVKDPLWLKEYESLNILGPQKEDREVEESPYYKDTDEVSECDIDLINLKSKQADTAGPKRPVPPPGRIIKEWKSE